MKYLTLIRAIALLHQYQRPVKEVEHRGGKLRYIEVTRQDIAIANRLCARGAGPVARRAAAADAQAARAGRRRW